MEETDKNLIDAHLQGDPMAFGELVRRYGDSLLGYLTKICRNREQAKDLFQETFKRVVSLSQSVGCDGDNCPELGVVAAAADCDDPAQEASKAEQKELVRRAVESLPDRQRVTLVLAYYQGLSYREVATALDCSIGTVKTQMFRALRTLAQRLPDISGVAK